MNVLCSFWLAIVLTCISPLAFSQKFADSAIVFKGYSYGGSTANLKWHSRAVDTVKTSTKIALQKEYLDTLNFLTSKVKAERHRQQKIGPSYYASVFSNGNERRIAIIPNWAIIDLKNNKQFVFRNTAYSKLFERFIENSFQLKE